MRDNVEERPPSSERLSPSGTTIRMASPRPKSPKTPNSAKKEDANESFWDKIGTLGRKKKAKEGNYVLLSWLMDKKFFFSAVRAFSQKFRITQHTA